MSGPWSSPCPPLRLRELSFHGPKMPSLPSKLPREWLIRLCSQHSGAFLAQSFKLSYTSPLPKVRLMMAMAAPLDCINVFGCLPFTVVKYLDKSIFKVDSGHCPLWWKRLSGASLNQLVSSRPQSGSRDHEYMYSAQCSFLNIPRLPREWCLPRWAGLPISAKINNAPQAHPSS